MTLSEKIKRRRLELGLTQAELCDGGITRNMLSCIENGTATPSLDTLFFIAERLSVPAGYLLSDEYDEDIYASVVARRDARKAFADAKYRDCIGKLASVTEDDEVCYLLAYSSYYIGLEYFGGGSLQSAKRYLISSIEYSDKTVYDTARIKNSSLLYLAICENVSLPLLEFDERSYLAGSREYADYELYKYLVCDTEFDFTNEQYSMHLDAKRLIKERRFAEALPILTKIEETRRNYPPNAYLIFLVYGDLETCYKNTFDFEKAYKCSSKRVSLLEGFTG